MSCGGLFIFVFKCNHLLYIIFTQVSLINIDANDIADGNPSVVLRLIWHIIVYYQVKHTIIA